MVPVSVWVSSKTDSETRLWVQGVYLRGDPRECVAPFIVWGKFARHKALEANGDATVGESGVTQANQPREGADYVDKGPANVPCWPHGTRHQVCGLKISPKCSSGSAQGSQGGLDKRFQQWPLKCECGWTIIKMSPTMDSSLYQCPCNVTLQLPPHQEVESVFSLSTWLGPVTTCFDQ